MATTLTQKFLQEHFRKHESLTLYKPDGTPVTFAKVYEPVLIVSQHEAYRFKNNERLAEFCNQHNISTHPTITLG
ncbi:MAG: hypothetical protein ACI3VK_05585 [Oscillospiraceae bacterium]